MNRKDAVQALLALGLLLVTVTPARAQGDTCTCKPGSMSGSTLLCFPFCKCTDYSANSLPWLLNPVEAVQQDPTYSSATFTIAPRPDVPAVPSTCYSLLWNSGIKKLEIDTSIKCNNTNVKVYVNSKLVTTNIAAPTNYPNKRYIRLGAFTPAQISAGVVITLAGTGSCNTLDTLLNRPNQAYGYSMFGNTSLTCCPTGCGSFISNSPGNGAPPPNLRPMEPAPLESPPPPPSPSPPSPPPPSPPPPSPPPPPFAFPHSNCYPGNLQSGNAGVTRTPYVIKLTVERAYDAATGTAERVCLDVQTRPVCNSTCCNMTLKKIELVINNACTSGSALQQLTVFNGTGSASISYDSHTNVTKVTNIAWFGVTPARSDVQALYNGDSSYICFSLNPKHANPICRTAATIFAPYSGAAYAYWGNNSVGTLCCGTAPSS